MGRMPRMLYRSAILLILCHLGHGGGAVAVAGPSPGVGGGNSLGSALWPRLVVRGGGGGDASIEKAKRVAAEKSAKFKEWIESRKTAARAEAAAAGIQVDGITATATATATPTSTACASGMESKSSGSSAATDSGTTTFKLYRVSPHPATGAVMLSHVHASSRGRLRQDDWCMGVSEADDLGYIAVSVIPGAGGGDIVPAAELAAEQELERGGGGATGTKAMGPNKGLFAKVLVMKECLVEAGGVDCVCTVSGRWRIKGRLALQREEASGPAGGGKRVAFASSPPRIDSRVPQAQASAPATPVPGGARAKHPASRQQAEQRPAHSETQQGSSSGEKTRVDTTAASPTVVSVSKLQDADPAPLPKLSSLSPSFEENEGGVSAGASAICMDPGAVSVVTLRDFRVGAEERDETPSPLRRARTSSRTPRGKFADSPSAAASPFGQSDTLMGTPLIGTPARQRSPLSCWSSALMIDDGDAASDAMGIGVHISGVELTELEDSSDCIVDRRRSTGGGDKTVVLSDNVMWGDAVGDGRRWDSRKGEEEEEEEEEGGGRGRQALGGVASSGQRWGKKEQERPQEVEQRQRQAGSASSPSRLKPPSSAGSRPHSQSAVRRGTPPPPPTPKRSIGAGGAQAAVPSAVAATATSVTQWLEGMGLGAYGPLLLDEGWDSMDLIASLTEADLRALGVKGGHARKMMLYRPKA